MKPIKPTCSLVTPTYNWPNALELLLISVKKQTVLPDEVIIADDGSDEKTTQLIQTFQADFPVPIIHIWHEDQGNRKPKIMNKAIASSNYDYIIEIDGDIILHPNFIEDHLTYANLNTYLFGSRVNIQKRILNQIFKYKITSFGFFSKGIKKRGRTLRIPLLMYFSKTQENRSPKLRGCNMSFWKKDFISVNGFNEKLTGWGIDDSEMIQRLHNIGIVGRRLKNVGIVYHIHHTEQDKSHIHENLLIEKETSERKIKFIESGINQYL
jgi:glycosyltransferase involved in cell wall biosynthesis